MMQEFEIRKAICEIGKRLYAKGYVAAKHGNISYKYSENEYFCTPSGVAKIHLTPDKIVKVDATGKKIDGGSYKPTSEVTLHIRMYQENPEVRCLIHAQPPFSTAYAIKNIPINNCVLPENLVYLGVVPKGAYNKETGEISQELKDCMKTKKGFLYDGMSVFSTGDTLENAFDNVDSLEFYTKMNFIGSCIPDAPAVVQAVEPAASVEAAQAAGDDLVKAITEKVLRQMGM